MSLFCCDTVMKLPRALKRKHVVGLVVLVVAAVAAWWVFGRTEGMATPYLATMATPRWHCTIVSKPGGQAVGHGIWYASNTVVLHYSPFIRSLAPQNLEVAVDGKRVRVTRVISDPARTVLVLRTCPGSPIGDHGHLGSKFYSMAVPTGTTLYAVTPTGAVVPVERVAATSLPAGARTQYRKKPVADQVRAMVTFQSSQCVPPGSVVYKLRDMRDRKGQDIILSIVDDVACGAAAKFAWGRELSANMRWLGGALGGERLSDLGMPTAVTDPPCP